jgi:spheroidene monooxygenase
MKPSALQGPVPVVRTASQSGKRAVPLRRAAGKAGPSLPAAAPAVGSVAVLVLVDLHAGSRSWGWSRLVLGNKPLRAVAGLGFSKVLGSGAGGGFGLAPSGTHQGLFLVFDEEANARRFIAESPVLEAYRSRSRELCVALLRACSSKGSWDGSSMAVTAEAPTDGPIAALTRASIRPQHALPFWRLSPPAEVDLHASAGCELAAGLGEAPLLRQATFSLWRNTAAMNDYARSGAHQQAIQRASSGGYFSETMFVRFVPLLVQGVWQGRTHGPLPVPIQVQAQHG